MEEIEVKAVELDNNRIIPKDVIEEFSAPCIARRVSYVDLELLRNNLTMWLIDNGYINSGVIIPDQDVQNGVIHLQVIEGSLADIKITGNRTFKSGYFLSRIEQIAEPPINIKRLQEEFYLLQQDPRIIALNAELTAGQEPGASNLSLNVVENTPWQIDLIFDNDHPPSTGSYGGTLSIVHRNLTGRGDVLGGLLTKTEGSYEVDGAYSLPLNARGTTIEIYGRHSESEVIDSNFDDLDIENRSTTVGGRLSQPLYRSIRQSLHASLSAEYRRSKNFLLGYGFSFSPLESKGKSSFGVGRLGIEWVGKSADAVLVASVALSTDLASDEDFTTVFTRMLWSQRLNLLNSRLSARIEGQFADNMLPPMEKYALGGLHSVRGYRTDLFVKDNGVNGSLEWQIPVLRDGLGNERLALIPFIDYGNGWDDEEPDGSFANEIIGVGAGFRATWGRLSLEAFYGHSIDDISVFSDYDIQDDGIHFLASWQIL